MKKKICITAILFLALSPPAIANAERVRAKLSGFQEVPAVSTAATGKFVGRIARRDQAINYTLSYSGLQGAARHAHIHLAQKGVNGSIMLWLCGTATSPGPAGTPTCPASSGSASGRLTAADVIATQASQQIAAGELDEVIAAIRAGVAYVNVHSSVSPGGELRGQLNPKAKTR